MVRVDLMSKCLTLSRCLNECGGSIASRPGAIDNAPDNDFLSGWVGRSPRAVAIETCDCVRPRDPRDYLPIFRASTLMISGLPDLMAATSLSAGSVSRWMRQQAAAAPSEMIFWTSSMLVLARRIW